MLEGHDADIPTETHSPSIEKQQPLPGELPETEAEPAPLHPHNVPYSSSAITVTHSVSGVSSSLAPHSHEERFSPKNPETEAEVDLENGKDESSSNREEQEVNQGEPLDPNIIDWDGPDDPQNARNWSSMKKWGNIAVIASITFLTYALLIISTLIAC